jgi:hypothetical protein
MEPVEPSMAIWRLFSVLSMQKGKAQKYLKAKDGQSANL